MDHDFGKVRKSPDRRFFLLRVDEGWRIYRIEENRAVRTEDEVPKPGDVEWFWLNDNQLLGVLQIYEADPDSSREMAWVNGTKLYLHDIPGRKTTEVPWPDVGLGVGGLIRLEGVAPSGEIELSAVDSEQYFDPRVTIQRLGRYVIVSD